MFFAVLPATATAQANNVPPLSGPWPVLYAHHFEDADDSDDDDEFRGWMNTLAFDPDSNDPHMGEDQSCLVDSPRVVPVIAEKMNFTWRFTVDPGLRADRFLDTDDTIVAVLHIGAPDGEGEDLKINTTLRNGDRIVAESEQEDYSYKATEEGDHFGAIQIEMTPTVSRLRANQSLVWDIHVEADQCSASDGPYLGVSDRWGKSRLDLPVHALEPAIQFRELGGAQADIDLTFDQPTDRRFAYNWTAGSGQFEVVAQAALDEGRAFVEVRPPTGGGTQFLLTANESSSFQDTLQSQAGKWRITVSVEQAVGSVDLVVRPQAPAPPGGPPQPTPTTTSPGPTPSPTGPPPDFGGAPPAGNDTDDDGEPAAAPDEGGDSPGLAVGLVAAALVAAAVLAGRRRDE